MTLRFVVLGILLASGLAIRAQDPGMEPPKLGQPVDFSEIVGVFRLMTKAEPTTVVVESPITLTVTITGSAVGPFVPKRDKLRLFPDEMQRDFHLEPVAETVMNGAWEFVYRLRPKHVAVRIIPGLKLVYYAPRQRRYQTSYSDAIPVTVQPNHPAEVTIPGLKVVTAPAWFFDVAVENEARFWYVPRWGVMLLVVGTPLVGVLAGGWWHTRQTERSRRRRRRRAVVEQTLGALVRVQSPEATVAAMVEYLRGRLNFPGRELTPFEIDRWLKKCGASATVRQRYREFVAACDTVRYGPVATKSVGEFGVRASNLVVELENEPCLAALA